MTKKTGAKRRKACSRKFLKLFLDNAKVLIRNASESFSFSPFPAIPSLFAAAWRCVEATSSRVKGCAMLVEVTKPPSRRTLDGKAV